MGALLQRYGAPARQQWAAGFRHAGRSLKRDIFSIFGSGSGKAQGAASRAGGTKSFFGPSVKKNTTMPSNG